MRQETRPFQTASFKIQCESYSHGYIGKFCNQTRLKAQNSHLLRLSKFQRVFANKFPKTAAGKSANSLENLEVRLFW